MKSPIFGISHLAYTGSQIDPIRFNLQEYGYIASKEKFSGKNPDEKKHFLKQKNTSEFEMTLYRNPHSAMPVIELLFHPDEKKHLESSNRSKVVLGRFLNLSQLNNEYILSKIHSLNPTPIPELFTADSSNVNSSQCAIIYRSPNFSISQDSFRALGFKDEFTSEHFSVLTFTTPFKKNPLTIVLERHDQDLKTQMLDYPGFSCLSFLVSNIDKTKSYFANYPENFLIGQNFTIKIEDRELDIFFAHSSSGELFEFITPKNKK